MRKKFLVLGLALISASVSIPVSALGENPTPDLAKAFAGKNGCFILFDVNQQKIITEYNPTRCAQRLTPASTFKVPLSLMAFDEKIINQNTVFKWDGEDKGMPQWNQDQTPHSWLKNSAVWVSQEITPQLGMKKIKYFLHKFNYGNQNFSGDPYQNNGLTHAWLNSSLKISAEEQLDFLKNFVADKLPVSPDALENTKENIFLETTPNQYQLYGKSGSCDQSGWFIGYIEKSKPNQTYIFVLNFSALDKSNNNNIPGGTQARNLTKKILAQMGLF